MTSLNYGSLEEFKRDMDERHNKLNPKTERISLEDLKAGNVPDLDNEPAAAAQPPPPPKPEPPLSSSTVPSATPAYVNEEQYEETTEWVESYDWRAAASSVLLAANWLIVLGITAYAYNWIWDAGFGEFEPLAQSFLTALVIPIVLGFAYLFVFFLLSPLTFFIPRLFPASNGRWVTTRRKL